MCEKREGKKGGGERQGREVVRGRETEDNRTGVEFTHPAGRVHYWHICFGVMSHRPNAGFLNEGDTQTKK